MNMTSYFFLGFGSWACLKTLARGMPNLENALWERWYLVTLLMYLADSVDSIRYLLYGSNSNPSRFQDRIPIPQFSSMFTDKFNHRLSHF